MNKSQTSLKKGLLVAALVAATVFSPSIYAEGSAIDPFAVQTLKKMTDFAGGLKSFSVNTQMTLEEQLESGQRVDMDIAVKVTLTRPNKLHAMRVGEGQSQEFFYNGKTLTLVDPVNGVYASQAAPGTIEEVLDYTREDLGLIIPMSDLVYRNAFSILMQDVTSAAVIGEASIGGVNCTHLAFGRPDVDFQVWVAIGEQPFPCKFVVTDTSSPALISTVTVTGNWVFNPEVNDEVFNFVAPKSFSSITFIPQNDD
jgi:hypothetical protein